MFKLSSFPIIGTEIQKDFESQQAGALSVFEGLVRNHNEGKDVVALEYEAVDSLCQKEAQVIFQEVKNKFDIINLKCVHRVGRLEIGECAVWVGVLAAHRDDAFKACRYIIDEIKHRLPIWKKEFYANGDSGWVNCEGCAHSNTVAANEDNYYLRQVNLRELGKEGQQRLKDSKVLVVGAGGLGSSALMALASCGVGHIGICEHDKLDETNLHRQTLYDHSDIGKSKIDLAAKKIVSHNPFVKIAKHANRLDAKNVEEIIKNYEVVLDCTDNFATKFLLNDACFLAKKVLVSSSVYQYEGQLAVLSSHSSSCLRCIWPDVPPADCTDNCADAGVLGTVPMILGKLQAHEAIKIIGHLLAPLIDQTLVVNLLDYSVKKIKHVKDASCRLCGVKPTIRSIDESLYNHRSSYTLDFQDCLAKDLASLTFVDIREPWEVAQSPLLDIQCMNIPSEQILDNTHKLDRQKKTILVCAKGVRSLRIVKELRRRNFPKTYSLHGGVDSIIHNNKLEFLMNSEK